MCVIKSFFNSWFVHLMDFVNAEYVLMDAEPGQINKFIFPLCSVCCVLRPCHGLKSFHNFRSVYRAVLWYKISAKYSLTLLVTPNLCEISLFFYSSRCACRFLRMCTGVARTWGSDFIGFAASVFDLKPGEPPELLDMQLSGDLVVSTL